MSDAKRPSQLLCGAITVSLIIVLFGDVIFFRASLAPIDYIDVISVPGQPHRTVSWLRPGSSMGDSQGDLGAPAWQFEPAIKFLAFCIRHGESPYWDPYTATGSLGPETMGDVKFSAFSLVVALLGGSSVVFSYTLVALFSISCYCLMRSCTQELGLSTLAAVAVCCLYFLNGFSCWNYFSQMGQPYFLAPIMLRALLLFTGKPSARHAAWLTTASVLFFSTTFFPTAVMSLLVVYSVSLGLRLQENPGNWSRLLIVHTVFPLAAIFCLCFLYLPIFNALFRYLDTAAQYQNRLTPGVSLVNFLSLFTPKHFWESYGGIRAAPAPPLVGLDKFVGHLGLVGPLLAVNAIFCKPVLRLPVLLLTLCLVSAVGQIFGIFPLTLLDHLPFFSFVRNTYWAGLSSLALVFLAGIGLDAITYRRNLSWLSVILIGAIVCSYFFLFVRVGISELPAIHRYLIMFWCILTSAIALLLLSRVRSLTSYSKIALAALLLLEGLYYLDNLRPYRSRKDEKLAPAFLWLKSEIQRHPGSRLLDIGESGIFPNWGSGFQIEELGDLNTGELPWYRDFYYTHVGRRYDNNPLMSLWLPSDAFLFTDESLSLANVRYVMVDRTCSIAMSRLQAMAYRMVMQDTTRVIYENPNPQPRSFAVSGIANDTKLPSDSPGWSNRSMASTTDVSFIRSAELLGIPSIKSGMAIDPSNGRIEITEYHHTRIKLRAVLPRPSIVVLTDSWSPNWRAFVDGKETHVAKVDMAFRGIALSSGTHDIVFSYRNDSVETGEVISAISVLGIGTLLYMWKRRETSAYAVNRT